MPSLSSYFGIFTRSNLPFIRQNESSECGLACLAMLLGYYGHLTDMSTLRASLGTSPRGVSAQNLIKMAANMNFSRRAFQVQLKDLYRIQAPAILHWNLDHFVVLVRTDKRGIVIHDPAQGQPRKLTFSEASDSFTGIVIEITPTNKFESQDSRQSVGLASLWSSSRGFVSAFANLLVLSIIIQGLLILAPLFMKIAVDEVIPLSDLGLLKILFYNDGTYVHDYP